VVGVSHDDMEGFLFFHKIFTATVSREYGMSRQTGE